MIYFEWLILMQIHECTRGCRLLLMDESASNTSLMEDRNGAIAGCLLSCVS